MRHRRGIRHPKDRQCKGSNAIVADPDLLMALNVAKQARDFICASSLGSERSMISVV
jgi:hypothetical protein